MKEEMTNKEIRIKDIADGLSIDIDTADIWANIEPQLPPVKKRRRVAFWWVFGLFFIGVALASITLYDRSESTPVEQPSALGLTSVDKNQINTTKTIEPDNKRENQPKNVNNQNSIITTKQRSRTSQSNYDDRYDHDLMNNSNVYSLNHMANDMSIVRQPIETSSVAPYTTADAETADQKSILNTDEVDNSRISIQAMSAIKRMELKTLSSDTKFEFESRLIKPVSSLVWYPYWQMNAGINQALSKTTFQIINTENPDQSEYEQNLFGLSNAIQYGQENNKGWRWFAGVSYDRLVTRYSNFDKAVTTTTELGEESKTIDSEGNEFVILGDIKVITVIQNDIVWHRNHDYVNLQLGIGKRMMLTNRLSVVGDAYSSYNIWSQHDGYYFDPNSPTIIKFDRSDENPYQNQGINIGGRLSLEYDLGTVSIGLSSLYESALRNTISTNQYNIKNSHYGVQLGVVYRP